MHTMTAISKQITRIVKLLIILAIMTGITAKAQDGIQGWNLGEDGEKDRSEIGAGSTAGMTTVGTTDYPAGGMLRIDALIGWRQFGHFRCGVIDSDRGYAWFGTYTIPGVIVKVALGDGSEMPRPVGYAILNEGEGYLVSAVIDKVNGYAYFGTQFNPARVIKVSLGEGENSPVRVGAVILESTEINLFSAVIDATRGYACFGTGTRPGKVIKIDLGEGNEPPSRVGAITLQNSESELFCGVIDRENGYAYFGTRTGYGRVIKIRLGERSEVPEYIGSIVLTPGGTVSYLESAVIDPISGYAYFGTDTIPGKIVKVSLGAGSDLPRQLGSIVLHTGENNLESAAIDIQNGFAYFVPFTSSESRVVKIGLGNGDESPFRIGSTLLDPNEVSVRGTMIDESGENLFVGTYTSPARFVKLDTGTGSDLPERIGSVVFDDEDRHADCIVIDPDEGYAYIGTDTIPGKVIKVKLGDTSAGAMRVGEVVLANGEDRLRCAVIDSENGYAYFGTDTNPGRVVKIALGSGSEPPDRVGSVTLTNDEYSLHAAVIDPSSGYAYFATNTGPGRVVEISLGQGSEPPERTNSLVLNSTESLIQSAIIDPSTGYAWFGTTYYPGYVVKVALGSGNPSFRVGAVELPGGIIYLKSAVIDTENMYGYFISNYTPKKLIKIALGWGWNPPEYVAELSLHNEGGNCTSLFDSENGIIYVGLGGGRVFKVNPGEESDPPELLGMLELPGNETNISCSVMDAARGYAYFGINDIPFRLVRVAPSHKNFIKGNNLFLPETGDVTSVSMYSHEASGHIRLALYNHGLTPALVWQSPVIENTKAGGWLNILVSDGEPGRLRLSSGNYWLVWQTDCMASVPSYSEGVQYGGIRACFSWGPFPDEIGMDTPVSPALTSDQWSAFLYYMPVGCPETGCTIRMPSHEFASGDPCFCSVDLCNSEFGELYQIPLFVVLDIYGSYYFAPSFDGMDWYEVTVPPGILSFPVLPEFPWPSNAGSASGIRWLAAMMNSRMTEIIGEMGEFTFGWR